MHRRKTLLDLPPPYQDQAAKQLYGESPKLDYKKAESFGVPDGASHVQIAPDIYFRQTKTFEDVANSTIGWDSRFPGLPAPLTEYKFHPTRKWRFDYYFPQQKVALEVQGGIFIQGRHSRGASLLKEYEKLNEAAAMGIRMLYCTPQQLKKGEILPVLKRALGITTEL